MDPKLKDVLFSVGRRLPDEDKIKLIDIIPGIGKYVKTLNMDTEQDEIGMSICALVKRLPNLRKVVLKTPLLPEDYVYHPRQRFVPKTPTAAAKYRREQQLLLKLAEINPRITEFEGFCQETILGYILRVKELDQTYEAGDVREVFMSGSDYLKSFFEKFPDAKLKLSVCIWTPEYEDKLVLNGRGQLVHDLELENGYTLRSEFKSVRILRVLSGNNFSTNLRLVPNVEEVRIGAEDPNIIESLLLIKNLRRLSLFSVVELTEANFSSFQSILMKPSLKHLMFHEEPDSELKLINAFLDCERNDFESLAIKISVKGRHRPIIGCSVIVKDEVITIYKPINLSLRRLFGKFKRIKEIVIKTKNLWFAEQIRNEIDLIVESLPRNRSLCVQMSSNVTSRNLCTLC